MASDQLLGSVSIFQPLIQNPHNIRTRILDATQLLVQNFFLTFTIFYEYQGDN